MYCPECGRENSDQARFCAACGTPLAEGGKQASGDLLRTEGPNLAKGDVQPSGELRRTEVQDAAPKDQVPQDSAPQRARLTGGEKGAGTGPHPSAPAPAHKSRVPMPLVVVAGVLAGLLAVSLVVLFARGPQEVPTVEVVASEQAAEADDAKAEDSKDKGSDDKDSTDKDAKGETAKADDGSDAKKSDADAAEQAAAEQAAAEQAAAEQAAAEQAALEAAISEAYAQNPTYIDSSAKEYATFTGTIEQRQGPGIYDPATGNSMDGTLQYVLVLPSPVQYSSYSSSTTDILGLSEYSTDVSPYLGQVVTIGATWCEGAQGYAAPTIGTNVEVLRVF